MFEEVGDSLEEWSPEIRFSDVLVCIKQYMWLIVFSVIVCSLIAAIGTLLLEEDVYQATSTVIMSKEAAKIFYEDEYTKSDIDLYQQVGNTYIEIADSNVVIDGTIEFLNRDVNVHKTYTRREIKDIVSANYITGTLVIKLTAISTGEDNVSAIANAYRQSFVNTATNLLPAAQLVVMDVAEVPQNPNNSKFVKNILMGFILGMVIAGCIIFIKLISSKGHIQTVHEINELLDVEVLVVLK